MADQTLTVTEAVKTGILDIDSHANVKAGNAAGADYFYFANDGRTVLVCVVGAAAKAITFTPVLNRYGRTETLVVTPTSSATSVIGPLKPHLFNQTNGVVEFQPAAGGLATDFYLALRITK